MVPLPETVLKIFSGIPRIKVFTLRWVSERSANLSSFREFFNFGKRQKSQGTNSGE
jgi:hypothetical protein